MIIDLILDRKDDLQEKRRVYNPKKFYNNVMGYGEIGNKITYAMDYGTEEQVKQALCEYIEKNEYNMNICDFVNSVEWLVEEKPMRYTRKKV